MKAIMFEPLLPKVLVVDDDPSVCDFLKLVITPSASRVEVAENAATALESIERGNFDIILCDIYMPGCTGMELLSLARQSKWDVGFILTTGQVHVDQIIQALHLGASDFLLKPFTVETLEQSISRAFRLLQMERESRAYRTSLETSIERRTRDLMRALHELEENYQTTLEALVLALDAREHETYAHSLRVRAYTLHMARLVSYPLALLPALGHAALLHDIGKIAVADAILLKPGKLTEEEWVQMRRHVMAGVQILNRIPFLKPAAPIVQHHHERYDGKGYPHGVAGEQIPLGARLFALADTLDAMTSDRAYRKALGLSEVRAEVARHRGWQFDPQIADLFLKVPEGVWLQIRDSIEPKGSS
ncbi:MAG TPA: HD domain-containing phosphohydrolase [Terriglobia bacterium]|nr:HD domain-containing phosphohydrolase [Terriglobia bacterium]